MSGREWGLSLLVVGFLALKVGELAFALESWPLSNVSMFCERRPREVSPIRVRLFATRAASRVELRGDDFRLSTDEFLSRLRPGPELGRSCGALVESYNRRRGGGTPLEAAVAVVEVVPRPGLAPREAQKVADPLVVACRTT